MLDKLKKFMSEHKREVSVVKFAAFQAALLIGAVVITKALTQPEVVAVLPNDLFVLNEDGEPYTGKSLTINGRKYLTSKE